ncbi:mitochondrial import protein Pam17-domain-containing protein [Flagelloscypha sp. PMI_526]|nr:mitochondrial import protein Pam17-domain-containing protein [Flagelloscypha sp. PMI_526]
MLCRVPLRNSLLRLPQTRSLHPSGGLVTETLNWPEYLAIRKKRRLWQTVATVPAAVAGLMGGALYFGSLETDPTKMIWGIDPFFFYGFCTVGTMGLGAVIGPSIGNGLWRLSHRRLGKLIDARDRDFFLRIQRNRVDASLQSPTKPIPDYYGTPLTFSLQPSLHLTGSLWSGEKIGSIKDYRQWLRDQRKYRKRAILEES